MLQQTQVARVEPRYREWMQRWPTQPRSRRLARGRDRGLDRARVQPAGDLAPPLRPDGGRARRLPRDPVELQKLPGIGPYTAAAVACFAFGAQIAAPDTNANRVLERAFGTTDVPVPDGRAYDWNQALFDLGREICIARRPRCERCPLRAECPSRGATFAPLRKQSRFEGSFRQRRSRLLREIAAAGELPLDAVDAEALVSLQNDGLIELDHDTARLPAV